VKLGTLRRGGPDGTLVVVSKDLQRAVTATRIAPTLLAAIEEWRRSAPKLQALYQRLNAGKLRGSFKFNPRQMAAPLPRTWQWLDASAFHSHGDLMERALHIAPPPDKRTIPLIYQGAGDDFRGPTDEMPMPSEDYGMDFEAEIAIVLDRVAMGTSARNAARHIKLFMLVNDASLRVLAAHEVKTGFGFGQSKPATSFGPVAVTADEFGPGGYADGRVQLPVQVHWNGREFGHPHAGQMGFSFAEIVARATLTRNLSAGTVIGSGTVSNENFREVGSACIAERRGSEIADHGAARTAFMKFGDRVRIEVLDAAGQSVFGAIDQKYTRARLAG
jgi:fumarylacetoacetate (FAA) hydrolase